MDRIKKNIIWIVIDTLRSDMLASCLSDSAAPNEIDEIIEQGVLFTDVMTTGGSTRVSAPAYFTSLRPGLTGMTNHGVQSIRNFNDDALTITEYFKHYGYQTFRWDDSSLDSCQPKRGFDVFESGYPTLEHTPHRSYDNKRRDAFIKQVRQSKKPFFVNFHLDYIHDFGGYQKKKWSTEEYLQIVSQQAKDFKALWDKVAPGKNDIVVVTSDHGCILDENYIDYDKRRPWEFSHDRTRVFASFIADGLVPSKKHKLIRSIDIAPTLLDLTLGKPMHGQGVSLKAVLEGGPQPELIGIAERNIGIKKKSITDFACIRKNNWSYYLKDSAPIKLYNHSDDNTNDDLLGKGLEIEKELHEYYENIILNGPQTATDLYKKKGISISDIRGDIEVSILLPVFKWSDEVRLCIESLLDQILLTELIVLDADESGEVEAKINEIFNDRLYLRHLKTVNLPLYQMLNSGLEKVSAPFTVTATPTCQYTENYCYSLRNAFLNKSSTVLSYPNLKRVLSDKREMEYIGNEDCFDEVIFSRLGSSFEHNARASANSLPYFNEIGACAMFETATLRNIQGFSDSEADTLENTWFKLSRKGIVKHVNKGLVISKAKTTLRPTMPLTKEHDYKISVLVPLLQTNLSKSLPLFLAMLSRQSINSLEVLLLNSTEKSEFIYKLAKNFDALNIRIIDHYGTINEILNEGIFASRGEHIFWSEPDEKLLPHCLSTLLEQIDMNDEVVAVKSAYHLHGPGDTAKIIKPMAQAREMLLELCDLRGLLYKRELHNDAGIFKSASEDEPGWDMCTRLALVTSFKTIEEPLLIACGNQFNIQPTLKSYRRVLRNAINSMGGTIDLVRLYEDDFRKHQADNARFILEDEMMMTLKLINKSGIRSGGMLRVPKT